MTPNRTKLLSILNGLEQAETATNKLITLDVGEPVDALAEVLGGLVEEMRSVVQELLAD
jgi:hypothetical protein